MSDETTISPQERWDAANRAWQDVTRLLPPDMQVMIPPHFEVAAAMDATARLLVEKGLVTEQEFVAEKTLAMAQQLEQLTAQVVELKRKATGLVIAGPGQQV